MGCLSTGTEVLTRVIEGDDAATNTACRPVERGLVRVPVSGAQVLPIGVGEESVQLCGCNYGRGNSSRDDGERHYSGFVE